LLFGCATDARRRRFLASLCADLNIYNNLGQAAASPHTPDPVAFGNVDVGATVVQALTATNTVRPGSYTEHPDATLTSSSPFFTAGGSFTGLDLAASNLDIGAKTRAR
jgi:hypothetical protein